MPHAIILEGLNKSFGSKQAVRDFHFTVPAGALYGVIGPNGAGKTTTLRMILSILFPDSGKVSVLGHDSALQAKDRIGYLPEERGVYRKMQVGAFLEHMAILKGLRGADARKRVAEWLERIQLPEVAKKRCEELSKGMQQKVQFIAAVVHRPELLILDEPFSGLDPVNRRLLKQLIQDEHQRGATVLFSTHVMPQAEEMCEHIVMIHEGRKMLDDPLTAIRARQKSRSLQFEALDAEADVAGALQDLPQLTSTTRQDGHWLLQLAPNADLGSAVQAVAGRLAPRRLELRRPSLEDVFVQIVSTGAEAAA